MNRRTALSKLSIACLGVLAAGCCCVGGLNDDQLGITPPQQPPQAVLTATPDQGPAPLAVELNASASTDGDGTLVSFDWDFDGDGVFDLLDGAATAAHTYATAGVYAARVRVTDNDGLTSEAAAAVTATAAATAPPTATGSAAPEGAGSTTASFDARASYDTDGTIVRYDWDFNADGEYELPDGGPTPVHDFGGFGTFTIQLRVTDNDGLQNTATIEVTLAAAANQPPVAAIVPTPASGNPPLTVSWDATGSSDSDGTVAQYEWDLNNDGTYEISAGNATLSVSYPTGGRHFVRVRVTDDDGATDTAAASVDVNFAPEARLAPTPDFGNPPLPVTWDATGSSDHDGAIAQYDWDLDHDGTFEIVDGGATRSLSYPASGVYAASVRVVDDAGASATATAYAVVNTPPTARLAPDPPTGAAPLTVEWNASASSDLDGTIVQYDWDLDHDGIFEISAGGPRQTVADLAYGEYTVGVRVLDNGGLSATATATVNVLAPPTASLVAKPNIGFPPIYVTWDAMASTDEDGTIVRYDWDLNNDGVFELHDSTPSLTILYIEGGRFNVAIRVTDNDGLTAVATDELFLLKTPE